MTCLLAACGVFEVWFEVKVERVVREKVEMRDEVVEESCCVCIAKRVIG